MLARRRQLKFEVDRDSLSLTTCADGQCRHGPPRIASRRFRYFTLLKIMARARCSGAALPGGATAENERNEPVLSDLLIPELSSRTRMRAFIHRE